MAFISSVRLSSLVILEPYHYRAWYGSSDNITCTDSSIPCDASNLIAKGMHCLHKELDLQLFSPSTSQKIFPLVGYGGSSNAITAIKAVLSLEDKSLKPAVLNRIPALKLDRTIAFFQTHSFFNGGERRI